MRYFRIKWKGIDNYPEYFIAGYPDTITVKEIGKELRAEIFKLTMNPTPSFAFEEISNEQVEKERKKGVIIVE